MAADPFAPTARAGGCRVALWPCRPALERRSRFRGAAPYSQRDRSGLHFAALAPQVGVRQPVDVSRLDRGASSDAEPDVVVEDPALVGDHGLPLAPGGDRRGQRGSEHCKQLAVGICQRRRRLERSHPRHEPRPRSSGDLRELRSRQMLPALQHRKPGGRGCLGSARGVGAGSV